MQVHILGNNELISEQQTKGWAYSFTSFTFYSIVESENGNKRGLVFSILDTRFTCNCIYSVFFRQLLFLNKYFYTQILANYACFFSLQFHRTVLSAIEQPFKSKLAFTSSIVCRKHIMANVKFTITFHMNFKRICWNNIRFIVRSKNSLDLALLFYYFWIVH